MAMMTSESASAPGSFLTTPVVVGLTVLVGLYLHSLLSWRARSRGRPLPPGPKGLPIIGNLLDMPKSRPWLAFNELCAQYGNVLSMRVLNQTTIILGDAATAYEFMERRSANTSDRKQTPSLDLTGQEWDLAFWQYNAAFKHHRRVFWQHFQPGALPKYRHLQRAASHRFLAKLYNHAGRLEDSIQYTLSSALLKITYGLDAQGENDETLAVIQEGVLGTREVLVAGGFLVDYLPFLRHLPEYLPGGGFQKQFAKWRDATFRLRDVPFERYQEAASKDGAPECIVSDVLASSDDGDSEKGSAYDLLEVAKNVGGVAFEAGSDTTISALETFFLAMSLYPDVQMKAQAELDTIVGPGRLPDFSDRDSLVYINALIKESLRWFNVAPLGMSHTTIDDDEFQGYFIPAGTILLANVWACMHDPEAYPDPDVFRPERFIRDGQLDPNVRDPYTYVFGFGRRICPGRYYADASLFINVASVLHVYNITPPLDEQGKGIKVVPRMSDGFATTPEDCRCTITPRGPWAESLILNAERDV